MHLRNVVKDQDVEEAHRIFRISTLNAASSGLSATQQETPVELQNIVRKVEDAIKRRVAIGQRIGYPKL